MTVLSQDVKVEAICLDDDLGGGPGGGNNANNELIGNISCNTPSSIGELTQVWFYNSNY